MKPALSHIDLFSGIGGFALAARRVGFETIAFSETDNYASKILKKHWPKVPNYGDIGNVPAIRADLITGGFPCQPVSHAGQRRGKDDDRWLWPQMYAVVRRCKPRVVVIENVLGLVTHENGILIEGVLSDLEAENYEPLPPLVIPACAVGAPHRRDRVWILANARYNVGSAESQQQQGQRPPSR